MVVEIKRKILFAKFGNLFNTIPTKHKVLTKSTVKSHSKYKNLFSFPHLRPAIFTMFFFVSFIYRFWENRFALMLIVWKELDRPTRDTILNYSFSNYYQWFNWIKKIIVFSFYDIAIENIKKNILNLLSVWNWKLSPKWLFLIKI